jgi:hypothetical protein
LRYFLLSFCLSFRSMSASLCSPPMFIDPLESINLHSRGIFSLLFLLLLPSDRNAPLPACKHKH